MPALPSNIVYECNNNASIPANHCLTLATFFGCEFFYSPFLIQLTQPNLRLKLDHFSARSKIKKTPVMLGVYVYVRVHKFSACFCIPPLLHFSRNLQPRRTSTYTPICKRGIHSILQWISLHVKPDLISRYKGYLHK